MLWWRSNNFRNLAYWNLKKSHKEKNKSEKTHWFWLIGKIKAIHQTCAIHNAINLHQALRRYKPRSDALLVAFFIVWNVQQNCTNVRCLKHFEANFIWEKTCRQKAAGQIKFRIILNGENISMLQYWNGILSAICILFMLT